MFSVAVIIRLDTISPIASVYNVSKLSPSLKKPPFIFLLILISKASIFLDISAALSEVDNSSIKVVVSSFRLPSRIFAVLLKDSLVKLLFKVSDWVEKLDRTD